MSKVLYDFLAESFLFNNKMIEEEYTRVTEKELNKELEKYREHSLNKAGTMLDEIRSSSKYLSVTMETFDSFLPAEDILKQCSLYMDAVVLYDPIFKLTEPYSKTGLVLSQYEGLPPSEEVNRADLLAAVKYLKNLTPAVAANFASFFPMSYVHEAPSELPLYASDNYFSDVLHPDLLEWFHNKVKVRSLEKHPQGMRILNELRIGRRILIDFEGHTGRSFGYNLFQNEIVSFNEESHVATFQMKIPEEPPEPDYFNVWVFQSINKSARSFYDAVMTEIHYSSIMGNSYFTRSPLIAELLDYQFGKLQGVRENALTLGLNLDLPIIKNVTLEKLMSVRLNDGEAFQNFRVALSKQLRELHSISDPSLLAAKIKTIAHEFEEVQIHEIDKKINQLKNSVFFESTIFLAALYASSHYGLSHLLPTLGAFGGGRVFANKDKWTAIKDNPAYFLWKLKR